MAQRSSATESRIAQRAGHGQRGWPQVPARTDDSVSQGGRQGDVPLGATGLLQYPMSTSSSAVLRAAGRQGRFGVRLLVRRLGYGRIVSRANTRSKLIQPGLLPLPLRHNDSARRSPRIYWLR